MVEIIEMLLQEHRDIEKLLDVVEKELNVFDRGERPDYEVINAVIDFFQKYPDSAIIQRKTLFTRNLRRGPQSELLQSLTLGTNIDKVHYDCVALRRLSTTFLRIMIFSVKMLTASCATLSTASESILR